MRSIAIGSAHEGQLIRLWVRDEGEGIELHEQERIFERFARGSQRPGHGHGAGLGLAIVKAIAEAHGGWVELESKLRYWLHLHSVHPGEPEPEHEDESWHAS